MKNFKVVVAHPYKQHSFELAEGLRRKGVLYKYITTVYYKKYNLTYLITRLLNGQSKNKAKNRCQEDLDPYVMQYCELPGLIKLFVMRVPFIKKLYNTIKYKSSDFFARKTAKYCIDNHIDAVIVYDDTSPLFGKIIKQSQSKTKVILDMSSAALPYLAKIYRKDMIISPDYADKLYRERKNALDNKLLQRAKKEIEYADYYLVASNFTKSSLMNCGVNKDRIYVCPYGVDSSLFKPGDNRNRDILHAVYIGGTKQFKGISYLIEAFFRLNNKPVDLTIIGINDLPEDLTNQLHNVYFTGVIMPEEVSNFLLKSDFAIFPSLGDGFGFAVTESLSAGCPVICTHNTGASDLIEDGINGFIIKPHSYEAIIEKVVFMLDNRIELKKMQINARKSVTDLTWDRYYDTVGDAVLSILNH